MNSRTLKKAGYELEVTSAVSMVTPHGRGLTVVVNQTPPYPENLPGLQQALNAVGVTAKWVGTERMEKGKIWIVVGEKP